MEEFLTVAELAKLVGTSKVTIYKKINKPEFKSKYVVKINGVNKVSKDGLKYFKPFKYNYNKDNSGFIENDFNSSLNFVKNENEKLHDEIIRLTTLIDQQQRLTLDIQQQNKELNKELKGVKNQLKIDDSKTNLTDENKNHSTEDKNLNINNTFEENKKTEHKRNWWHFW